MEFFARLFGYNKKSECARSLPQITSESEEGFVDLVFAITESDIGRDGSASIHAQGKHEGETIGLRVVLLPPWKEGTLGDDLATFQGRVLYETTGAESDRFVQVLGRLYESSIRSTAMRTGEVPFTAITLEGDPHVLSNTSVKIKLFVESEKEDKYVELYTNVDVQRGRLEIREKDPGYRDAVIKAIGKEREFIGSAP